jgi:hypothetical protein
LSILDTLAQFLCFVTINWSTGDHFGSTKWIKTSDLSVNYASIDPKNACDIFGETS